MLHKRLWLNEAHFHTIDALAFAGLVLLVVEQTSGVSHLLMEAIQSSKRARELLLLLSLQNPSAATLWEILSVSGGSLRSGGTHADALHTIQATFQPHMQAVPKRPATLLSQDSAVDVASPAGSCFNPSPHLSECDVSSLVMPIGVDPVVG